MSIKTQSQLWKNFHRNSLIRANLNQVSSLRADQKSKWMLSHNRNWLCDDNGIFLWDFSELPSTLDKSSPIFLGEDDDHSYFALAVTDDDFLQHQLQIHFKDTRSLLETLSDFHQHLLLYAQGLLSWHQSHIFCSKCGHKTESTASGHSRLCLSHSCGKTHFPRIEPAVIFSIQTREVESRLLLARQKVWPKGRYSTLAGFVEHGESLEQSVFRECWEEVGIVPEGLTYFASQPWPFPASLMLGYRCYVKEKQVTQFFDQEIEEALWLTAVEYKELLLKKKISTPQPFALSFRLISTWYKEQTKEDFLPLIESIEA